MSEEFIHIMTWVLGALGALFVFLFGIWWKIENRQDRKIDKIAESNGKEHKELHDKIDTNHHSIRDRLDNIWKHVSRNDS